MLATFAGKFRGAAARGSQLCHFEVLGFLLS